MFGLSRDFPPNLSMVLLRSHYQRNTGCEAGHLVIIRLILETLSTKRSLSPIVVVIMARTITIGRKGAYVLYANKNTEAGSGKDTVCTIEITNAGFSA